MANSDLDVAASSGPRLDPLGSFAWERARNHGCSVAVSVSDVGPAAWKRSREAAFLLPQFAKGAEIRGVSGRVKCRQHQIIAPALIQSSKNGRDQWPRAAAREVVGVEPNRARLPSIPGRSYSLSI
jgi:hypothetical protein